MRAVGWFGSSFAPLYACVLALASVAALGLRARLRGAEREATEAFAPDLHPIEIAYLAGGVTAAIGAAVASVRRRALTGASESAQRRKALHEVLTHDVLPVERAVYTLVAKHGGAAERTRREVGPMLGPVRSRLTWLKLLAPESSVRRAHGLHLLLFCAVLALGTARLAAAEASDVASGSSSFYVFCLCMAAAWLMIRLRPPTPCRTRRGDQVLEQLRAKHIALLWKLREQPHRLPAKDYALAVALFGEHAEGVAYAAIGQVATRRTPSGVVDHSGHDGGSVAWPFN